MIKSLVNGQTWKDTDGNPIQAHGGQVQRLTLTEPKTGERTDKWWWVGEDKSAGNSHGGICAYRSDDLINWKFEDLVMRTVADKKQLDEDVYFKKLYKNYSAEQLDRVYECLNASNAIIERPKMIFNEKTGQYVLWFHADGTAYIIYSSEENLTLYISKLNEDYTNLVADPEKAVYGKDFIRLFPGAQREAPVLFRRNGDYYLITSGCTGWTPNQARYYRAGSVLDEWENCGDPCIGDEKHTTFDTQSTCVFVLEDGTFIYMGDRWNSRDLKNSGYVWLQMEFDEGGNLQLRYADEWKKTEI